MVRFGGFSLYCIAPRQERVDICCKSYTIREKNQFEVIGNVLVEYTLYGFHHSNFQFLGFFLLIVLQRKVNLEIKLEIALRSNIFMNFCIEMARKRFYG